MKKFLIILCALCCSAAVGCSMTDGKVDTDAETQVETAAETQADTTDETLTETTPDTTAETEVTAEDVPMPEVFLALRDGDVAEYPEDFTPDEAFLAAVSAELAEKLPDLTITARVKYIQGWVQDGFERYNIECEIYPMGAEIREENLLNSHFTIGLALTEDGYSSAEPSWIDETAPATIRENFDKYSSGKVDAADDSEYLHLDRENRVILHLDGRDVITDMDYDGSISDLDTYNLYHISGDTILICGMRNSIYTTPFSISLSRDGGETWHTETPTLEPLGKNGVHIEAGFTNGVIQMKDDGRFYIFLGTNLCSVTILTIAPESCEPELLFREQIGGYEITSLTDAAMITDTRGFFTLSHPKYAASNAIYRTTDGGETWVRCEVPMPDECDDPYQMALYLPYQTEKGAVWYMDGSWGTGSCVYVSEDGGWTWTIMEVSQQ